MAKTTTPDTSSNEPEGKGTPKQEILHEKTPLGLSAEQMKKSNPEAVKQMEEEAAAKAKTEAKTESAKALSEMKAAFPEDLEFAIEAHSEGLSVEQAKAKRYDDVVEKNKTLETENADLKKQTEKIDVNFAESADEGEGGSKTAAEWENEAAKIWDKNENGLQAEFAHTKTTFLAYYKNNGYKL